MHYKPAKHVCALHKNAESLSYVSKFSKIQQFLYLPSKANTKTKYRLPSLGAILKEAKRISRTRNKLIHPLSLCRVVWEVFLIIQIYVALFIFPMHLCFSVGPDSYKQPLGIAVITCQVLAICDVYLSHRTGYYENDKEEAIMSRKATVVKFWKSWSNVLALISALPVGPIVVKLYPECRVCHCLVNLLLLFKLFELKRFLSYFDEVLIMLNTNPINAKLLEVILLGTLLTQWMGCLSYFGPIYFYEIFEQDMPVKSWVNVIDHPSAFHIYVDMQFRAISLIISCGHDELIANTNVDALLMLVLLITSEVFVKIAIVYILDVIHLRSAAVTNYEMELDKVNSYMRYKKLSLSTQKRIISYYDYKFERMYLDEKGLASAVTETLHDINSYLRHKMIKSINILRNLDDYVIDDLILYMKEEIFLPNDIIIKSNTHASCMYFLYSGTVCIKTPNGKEVCHISEGSYFGEIGIVKERKRTADVIALEICHVFRLDRKICKTVLFKAQKVLDEIKVIADSRAEETRRIEETHKRLLMEKIIHMDTERYSNYEY